MKTEEQIREVIAKIDALKEAAEKANNSQESLVYLKEYGELELAKQFLKWIVDDNYKFCVKSNGREYSEFEIMRLL